MQSDVSFDLIEITRVLWRRKWMLLLCGIIVAGAGLAVSLAIPRRYDAEGTLLVRSEALTAPDTEAAFYSSAINEAVVTTEQEVVTSEGLLRRLAETLDVPAAMAEPPGLLLRAAGALEQAAGLAGGPALRERVQAAVEGALPRPPATDETRLEARTRFIAKALTATMTKGSSVITLRAVTTDPRLSANIVNGVMALYMQDRLAEQGRTAQTIEAALRERLRQTRLQISEGEEHLVNLLRQPGAIENSEVPGVLQGMGLISAQLTQAQADLARRRSDYEAAVHMRDRGGAAGAPDSLSYMVSGDLRRQLSTLQQENARISTTYMSDAPARRALQQQIAVLQSAIAAEASRGIEQRRTELAAAQATVDSLQQQVDATRQRRQSQSSSTIDVDRQRQAVASLWKISDALETRLIDLAARPTNPNARILSMANVPTKPSFPSNVMFVVAGFVLGTVGAGTATIVTSFTRRLRPLAIHLAEQLNGPLLGGLPEVSGRLEGQRRLLRSAVREESRDGLAATLRAVALELEDAIHQERLGCVAVTSGKPAEGKTTVAIALGRAMSTMSTRVLLIDLDLRRPSVERVFAASAADLLEGQEQRIGPKTVLRVKADRQSGLHVLTPFAHDGRRDPIAYLRSPALRDLVALARGSYDLILFDTPPVMSVPDALEVARLADAILLVAELNRSDEAERAELSRRLARTRKPICGVVATKVSDADMRSGAYSGYAPLRLPPRQEPVIDADGIHLEQASPS